MTLNARLAWRNIWRQKRRTWLTASAMIFSNVLLVFMISIQISSYDTMIENTLRSFSGHIQLQAPGYLDEPRLRTSLPDIQGLASEVRDRLPTAAVAARAVTFALASSEERTFGIQISGVQAEQEPRVSNIPGLVKQGDWLDNAEAPDIVIGTVLARNLKVELGDEITLIGSGRDGSFAAGVVQVKGIFDSGISDLDRSMSYVPLSWFQDTFFMEGQGNSVVISLEGISQVGPTMDTLAPMAAGEDWLALDWMELQPGLKQAIQADFASAWFMYGVLIILVAFSVLNTQLMSVMERTREFGVITALGIKPARLAWLVILETAMMGLIGLVVGVLIGWLVTGWFAQNGLAIPAAEEAMARYNMPTRLYPSIHPVTLLMGPLVVFIFCLLASVYPASRLFRLRPVEAMRAI